MFLVRFGGGGGFVDVVVVELSLTWFISLRVSAVCTLSLVPTFFFLFFFFSGLIK